MSASRVRRALDTVLDRAIVPGYSRLGYGMRRDGLASQWPADPAPGALDGSTVAVTGANSGLGLATVRGLVDLGADVRLLCRDTDRGERARDEVLAGRPAARLTVDRCDLSDLASVRACATRLRDELPALHGLVHSAGVLPTARSESADGHELTVATHVLGPHLLTAELRPLLSAAGTAGRAGTARVVFVSFGGMYTQRLRTDDPEYQQGEYAGATAYARTKRMQVVLAQLWAAQLADEHVAVHAMHPGWARTPGITDALPRFARVVSPILRSPEQGADTVVWLVGAAQAGEVSGLFWHDRRPRPTSYLPTTRHTPADARTLWDYCTVATRL